MGITLNRGAYQKLIDENIAYLKDKCPRTLERDHIIHIVEASVELLYGKRGRDYDTPERVKKLIDSVMPNKKK